MSKVAACIIADEVLAGKTLDTNSNYLAKKCFDAGLNLCQVRVIPDVKAEIIRHVHELSANHSLVFTSGGIGPTHDDLTYESIAEAYNLSLVLDDQTVSAMQSHYKTPNLSDSQLRMATIPNPSAVFRTAGLWIPLVQVRNVLILPGVPRLFQLMTDSWFLNELPEFIAQEKLAAEPRIRLALKTLKKESEIAAKLAEMQNQVIQHGISIGSYPKLFEDGSSYVIICLTGLKNQPEPLGSLAQKIIWEFDAVFSE